MKKSTAALWIAVAGIIAAVFCVLYISGMIRKDAEIEALKGSTVDQAARILELDADNAEKDTRIGDLSAEAEGHAAKIEELAIRFAKARPACLVPGLAIQRTGNGEQVSRCMMALACLCGYTGVSGGSSAAAGSAATSSSVLASSMQKPFALIRRRDVSAAPQPKASPISATSERT